MGGPGLYGGFRPPRALVSNKQYLGSCKHHEGNLDSSEERGGVPAVWDEKKNGRVRDFETKNLPLVLTSSLQRTLDAEGPKNERWATFDPSNFRPNN